MRYDALLLVSFGGPEKPDDVIPFLENVTRGRGVPRSRLEAVAEHYYRFGGASPINDQCRTLKSKLQTLSNDSERPICVYWGNRNWHPFLTDAVRQMAADGVKRAAAFVTSAYSGYSCCRQYLDDIHRARVETGPGAPEIEKLRIYFNHPGFVQPVIDNVRTALKELPPDPGTRLVFTAHSVPLAQPGREYYVAELNDVSSVVAGALGLPWDLVFQSRSGPPSVPWLEPDVCDHLRALHAEGVGSVVLVPVGFVTDHMEVVYDLDVEAAELAGELGMSAARARTAGTDPRFTEMVFDLMAERASAERPALGLLGPRPDACPPDCCRRINSVGSGPTKHGAHPRLLKG